MYKGHSVWDEEQDKYDNIVSDRTTKADYSSEDKQSEVYNSQRAEEERKKGDETGIEREVVKEEKKYERKEADEEGIKRKAASEVHEGTKTEEAKGKKDKKAHKSIEDAINKAMKEEKEVIYMND